MNGCSFCIDMHTKDARALGETEQRIYALPAWRETAYFSDRERAARVKFLYQIDVDDPLLYDLVLNTERLTVGTGAALIRETLRDERFQSIETGRKEVVDLSLAALARAALIAHPQVGARSLVVTCKDAHVSLRGGVRADEERTLAADVVGRIPGVVGVLNEIVVMHPTRTTAGL